MKGWPVKGGVESRRGKRDMERAMERAMERHGFSPATGGKWKRPIIINQRQRNGSANHPN